MYTAKVGFMEGSPDFMMVYKQFDKIQTAIYHNIYMIHWEFSLIEIAYLFYQYQLEVVWSIETINADQLVYGNGSAGWTGYC